ncbi:hypothetical protein Kpol_1043p59 [Vanderwaltozyma polyspora DSM 70294]|uniref:Zinc/iron permease n=1 Tax=Vanderwaltozyma polyspora (strain ATCC 22028 / DSM 70294 / BCRC 21397 / CBS 2163 / NBRC 10782 / NRRL Y-8283 / UCD 57-17) TaxID=436907 RepID=A7TIS7_VANPO|nr:uncharacterized protein Kpol_1043p59 [Vanderwaltozyma polyspora DSM 70294]EDO17869.1 hypothetical protein Kpol_1043p59 [Vanderwaltozyma polyspora DSM 70294]
MAVGLGIILFLAFGLLIATFSIGIIPLYWMNKNINGNDANKYIGILSQFGIGMLLGTSFMLVIPEGVKSCVEHDGNVGLNLLLGFLIVYLLDRGVHILMRSPNNFNFLTEDASLRINSVRDLIRNPKVPFISILKNNVVFALFIHGLSDGIALGTTSNNESLLIVVLIAIVIHKIPAVLSLTSLMISRQRLPEWEVISNLFAFSLSTPLGYILVSLFNLKHSDTMDWVGGNLLLMSGGSLLYASFTAFVGGDSHDHHVEIPSDEPLSSMHMEDSSAERLDSMSQGDEEEGVINKSLPIIVESGSQYEDNNSSTQLPHDESVYILLGVIIPVIVSFLISED